MVAVRRPAAGRRAQLAATGADPWRGGVLLTAYAAGIGVPFVLASLGLVSAPKLASRLAAVGAQVERVAGGLLVVLGVLLATGAYRGPHVVPRPLRPSRRRPLATG